jgi:hypothetical protein
VEGATAKYKLYNYSQRVMIPVSLGDQLIPGTLEFAIHTLVEDRVWPNYFGILWMILPIPGCKVSIHPGLTSSISPEKRYYKQMTD